MNYATRPIDVDPVVAIEQAVQAHAAEERLAVDAATGRARLRELVDHEVRSWDESQRRSGRLGIVGDADRLAERVFGNLAGYGPLAALLDDDDVWEIMINAPGAACH